MTTLNFTKLYHRSFDDQPTILEEIQGVPGVYIWGFMFDRNQKGEPNTPIHCTGHEDSMSSPNIVFVPYYVGETEDLYKRLCEHFRVRHSHAAKYTRMSWDHLAKFYKNPGVNSSKKKNKD